MESISSKYASPTRQSRVAIGIILIKFIRFTLRSFWPLVLSLFIGRKAGNSFEEVIGYVALGIAALNLLGSVLTYFRFYFHIEEGAFIIDKGVLKKTKTNIPFERIQTINLQQNLLHQMFGVVSLEIDTAGAKKSELTIDALRKEDAEALRKYILEEREQLVDKTSQESARVTTAEREEEVEETILSLSITDLFKVGVSQNHLKSMAILFAFVFSTLNELTDDVEDLVREQLSGFEEYVVTNSWIVFLGSVIIVAIIAFLYSLINTVLKNFELKLSTRKRGLKLVRGLFNREEISINRSKVQTISWSDNPLRKAFKMFTLEIEQASSAQADQLKAKIKIPGCYHQQVKHVVQMVFPFDISSEHEKHRVSHLLRYRLWLTVSLLPALVVILPAYYFWNPNALWLLLWIPTSLLAIELYYRKRSFELTAEMLRNNKGTFGNTHEIIQLYKVQAVIIKQSWYQRRKNLATVELSTAAGDISIPFIAMEKAEALENYVLYKVESSTEKWM